MRLHTDLITELDIHAATGGLPNVYADVFSHGSRSRERAFEVRLTGNGYRVNSGNRGAGFENGATWDEWGVFLARLFEVDPHAFWGSATRPVYPSRQVFHQITGNRFREGELPADTHRRHTWEVHIPRLRECIRCSAVDDFNYRP